MSKRHLSLTLLVLQLVVLPTQAASVRDIHIDEVLQLAEEHSPALNAAQLQEIAAKKAIKIAKAGYYPVLNFEAIDTAGFPGSSSIMGIQGLMGSPYRKGISGGLVAKQTIWDFGRTSADVKRSKYEVDFAKQNKRVTSYEVKQLALETFYECSRYKTQKDIWQDLSQKSNVITTEVKHFVNTGQRSIVDKYLSEAQTEEAKTNVAYFSERMEGTLNELTILLGMPSHTFTCPSLASQKGVKREDPNSPFIERARSDAKIAQAAYQREKADLYPKIVSFASIGAMDQARLVGKKDYAVGIGVICPLFDLTTVGNIQRAKVIALSKNEEVEAQRQFVDDLNAKLDKIIDASKTRLEHLTNELKLAQEAFSLARKRYFSMEGELIDLREAFRNLARVQIETEDTRANLLQAKGAKALLNGERD